MIDISVGMTQVLTMAYISSLLQEWTGPIGAPGQDPRRAKRYSPLLAKHAAHRHQACIHQSQQDIERASCHGGSDRAPGSCRVMSLADCSILQARLKAA